MVGLSLALSHAVLFFANLHLVGDHLHRIDVMGTTETVQTAVVLTFVHLKR